MMGILTLAVNLATVTVLFLVSDITVGQQAPVYTCQHGGSKPTIGVYIEGSETLGIQSQTQESNFKPIRVYTHYDGSINTDLSKDEVDNLKNVMIPGILEFVDSLKVRPLTGPVLLDRQCSLGWYWSWQKLGHKRCFSKCDEKTVCGEVAIPESHLKQCIVCQGRDRCRAQSGSVNGPGISDTDLIIYVSAKNTYSCDDSIIAYASACQLESVYDRPIAGNINFCPGAFKTSTSRSRIQTGIHELFHVLAFSDSLFPFFRDMKGNPRTPRNKYGEPPMERSINNQYRGFHVASENTVAKRTYHDWLTRNGQISHSVTMITTPKVIEEAKAHFGCDNVTGVELENQGGSGSVGSHWEFRVLGGDSMVSTDIGAPGVFSRISLALLEDSGWYIVDYNKSESLSWGKQSGCDIVHGSCLAYIKHQEQRNESLSPFCNEKLLSLCASDRKSSGVCNLKYYPTNLDPEYQYFNSPLAGGNFDATDFCPISLPIGFQKCTDADSRCIETTAILGTNFQLHKTGCYKFSCTPSGVYIHYQGFRYLCECEGEKLALNISSGSFHYQDIKFLTCPSCLSLCYDQIDKCPSKEKPACPGQVASAGPVLPQPVDVQASCSQVTWRKPDDISLDIITGYEIRMFDSATGQSKTKHLHPSATYYDFHSVHDATFTSVSTSSIQIRLVANTILGEFSPLKSLGCQNLIPYPKPSVYFELNGNVYNNNSVVNIAEIGVGKNALLCKTDLEYCCAKVQNKVGEFFYPNGVQVPTRHFGHAFYLDRGPQQIRLNRRKGIKPTTGVYTCVIPDTSGLIQKLHMIMTDGDKQ